MTPSHRRHDIADKISGNQALSRLIWHCYYLYCVCDVWPSDNVPVIDEVLGKHARMFAFIVLTSHIPEMVKSFTEKGIPFNMPGTIQINKTKSSAYPDGVKKSTVKAGQELEGVFTVTLLRVGMGEWKIHYSSLQPLMSLNPLRDTMNGVAPSKKSKDRLTHFSYTWCKDDTEFYTRNDKNTKSRFSY